MDDALMRTSDALREISEEPRQSEWARKVLDDAATGMDRMERELYEFHKATAGISLDRLTEICAAEKDGRCVVLPCKVGDTFYTIEQQWTLCHLDNYRDEYSCQGCEEEKCDSKKVPEIVAHKCSTVSQLAAYIGKTVFLTRPEAEAAMKGGGD